jgi:nitrate reductase delta subunit
MITSYRALAALLSYPDPELIAALPDIRRAAPAVVAKLLDELESEPLHVLQERYVALFDRSRALSLHLFEHVHGESRDRGQAMVDLARTYAARGWRVAGNELPDYLPAFLEFISLLPRDEGRDVLSETGDVLRALGERLAERGSQYALVFAALLEAAGEPGLTRRVAAQSRAGEESSPAALDKSWMDEPVTFMDGPQPVRFYAKGARP